jgi:hypothetical protein
MISREEWRRVLHNPRIGLPSTALDEEMRRQGLDLPVRTGNYFVDQFKFLAFRCAPALFHLFTGPVEFQRHTLLERREPADYARHMANLLRLARLNALQYEAHRDTNLAILERLIRRIRAVSSAQVVLLESTWNPDFLAHVDHGTYTETIEAFAARHQVEYWDLNAASNFKDKDFVDYGHVHRKLARERFARVLSRRMLRLLETG